MAYGDSGVPFQEQQGDRLAHDIAAPDHHGVLAHQGDARMVQQAHDAGRGAGYEPSIAHHQPTHVFRVEPVHVLSRCDGVNDRFGGNVLRQRQLNQDAVHFTITVELRNQPEQVPFRDGRRQLMLYRSDARLVARFRLVAYVNLRSRVFADQNHGQTGMHVPRGKVANAHSQGCAELARKSRTVDDACFHEGSREKPSLWTISSALHYPEYDFTIRMIGTGGRLGHCAGRPRSRGLD